MIFELLDTAEADLEETHDFLEERESGLGKKFVLRFWRTLVTLQVFPELSPRYYRNVRMCRIRKTKHGIFFRIRRKTIFVMAVMDLRRDPKYLKRRLREI